MIDFTDDREGCLFTATVHRRPIVELELPGTPVKTSAMIANLLGENPKMTLAEVAASIGRSLSAVERVCSSLVKSGKLRFVGPKKGGHWEVV